MYLWALKKNALICPEMDFSELTLHARMEWKDIFKNKNTKNKKNTNTNKKQTVT